MSNTDAVTTGPVIGSRDKSVGWYDKNFDGVKPDARELLEKYTHIAPDKVDEYAQEMRDKAWEIYPYPCIGQFRFLQLNLCQQPSYKSMVQQLKNGGKYLDIGCCIGQDIRKLVADGAPAENICGVELEAPFIDLGFDFFRDRDTLKVTFKQADVFDQSEKSPLQALVGTIDFIHLGMILHIFQLDAQIELLERCIKLLKPIPGVLILGQAVGDADGFLTAGQIGGNFSKKAFRHNDKTFKELWKEIETRTNTKWECRASIDSGLGVSDGKRQWDLPSARRLVFEVERLE